MTFAGRAFRTPKQTDLKQWQKVRLLMEAGFRFYQNGGPKPAKLREVPAFLKAHLLAGRSRGARLLDDLLARNTAASAKWFGHVQYLNVDGRPGFLLLGRELVDGSLVLINLDGQWQAAMFRCTGFGMKNVKAHVEVRSITGTTPKRIFVTKQTVLRWPD
jgi:hypothetical protein